MTETLSVIWTDHRGIPWDLTTGDRGVRLELDQEGLGWAPIKHVYDGTAWRSASVGTVVPKLRVIFDAHLRGEDFYRLHSEWWEQANSPFHPGTLAVKRPGKLPRTVRARLGTEPDTSHRYDPGLPGYERPPELWALTTEDSWWAGSPQTATFTPGQVGIASGTPFYGTSGAGWPLNIGSSAAAEDAFLSNDGVGPMWPVWTITGPAAFPRVGTAEGQLAYSGVIAAGEQITIDTNPAHRRAWEESTGESRWSLVSGTWAPIPVGERVPLVLVAESMSAASSISVTASAQYAQGF